MSSIRKIFRAFELYANHYVRRRTPTIVYSVERSGSIVVFDSLLSHGEFAIATHHLDPEKIKTGRYSGSAEWASKHLILNNKKVRVISLVRNPVQSMVSFFARSDFGDRMQEQGAEEVQQEPLSIEQLSRQFTCDFLEKHRYRHHLNWFEAEFQAALGIDVYEFGFNKEEGYVQFSTGPVDVLILRTEIADDQKSQLISDFLGQPDFRILRAARSRGTEHGTPGAQSPYAEKYKLLKEHLTIPEKYLDEIVESKYSTHFFTQNYLDETRQQFSC